MNTKEFVSLMQFPQEWLEWEMIPLELARIQLEGYESGHESAPEHDRNGAFHWWLKKSPPPTEAELLKILKLTYLDPDQLMASDVRKYILQSSNSSIAIQNMIEEKP